MIIQSLKERNRHSRNIVPKLLGEQLEQRTVLDGNAFVFWSQLIIMTDSGGGLVEVTETTNTIDVRFDSGNQKDTFPKRMIGGISFWGGDNDDVFKNHTGIPARASGNGGNDTLIGGSAADKFFGGAGNDVLDGRGGHDKLHGENGNDTLVGASGRDWLYGDHGNDILRGGTQEDWLFGGIGNDVIEGGDGSDRAVGGKGNDTLRGGSGSDTLMGDGYLLMTFAVAGGRDIVEGGPGDDYLHGGGGNDILSGQSGNDRVWGEYGNDVLNGGAGRDVLYGNQGDDTLNGDDGNDNLRGGDGHDTLRGGAHNDELDGGAHGDFLYGNPGNDVLKGGTGWDKLYGGDGNDVIKGGEHNDYAEGGWGNDRLEGGAGDDDLRGGRGNDVLVGEAGADKLSDSHGRNSFDGGEDLDTINGEKELPHKSYPIGPIRGGGSVGASTPAPQPDPAPRAPSSPDPRVVGHADNPNELPSGCPQTQCFRTMTANIPRKVGWKVAALKNTGPHLMWLQTSSGGEKSLNAGQRTANDNVLKTIQQTGAIRFRVFSEGDPGLNYNFAVEWERVSAPAIPQVPDRTVRGHADIPNALPSGCPMTQCFRTMTADIARQAGWKVTAVRNTGRYLMWLQTASGEKALKPGQSTTDEIVLRTIQQAGAIRFRVFSEGDPGLNYSFAVDWKRV